MRIAQVAPLLCELRADGARYATGNVVRDLTRGLIERGHDVTVFSVASSEVPSSAHLIATHEQPVGSGGVAFEQAELEQLSTVYKQAASFDVIHTHLGNNGQVRSMYFAPLVSTPTVSSLHCLMSELPVEQLVAHQDSSTFVAISRAQLAAYPAASQFPIIHHGIDLDRFVAAERSGETFLFVGRLHPEKGAHIALDVARSLDLTCDVIGHRSTSRPAYFTDQLAPFFSASIRYRGPLGQRELNGAYQQARAVFHTTQCDEPFGLVVAEANACGTPVIATPRGAMTELIVDGENGFLAKTDDVAGVRAATERLLALSDEDYRALRRRTRAYAEAQFSLQRMAEAYETLYDSVR